jgi:CheY-like chemotaxis protein
MDGRVLADKAREVRPGLPVLLTSGHAPDQASGEGVVTEGTHFLPKPFTDAELAQKVREALDGAPSERTARQPGSPLR